MPWARPETCAGRRGMPRTPLARPGWWRTSPRTISVRPPMRSRPRALAQRKARAKAPGGSSAGGSVTSSRRRFASSSWTTSGCGTTSAGRCLTAERASGALAPSADQQHELAAHATVLADAVRLRDLDEREGLRDREREAPGLDQLADLGERVDRAAGVPSAERHSVLLRATEVGDRHDVLRAARELDELGQDAAPGDVERHVDAAGRERADPPDQALAVGDGLGRQRAQVIVVGRTGRADHARAAHQGELNRGAADASRGAVDEQGAAGPDAELVKRAR